LQPSVRLNWQHCTQIIECFWSHLVELFDSYCQHKIRSAKRAARSELSVTGGEWSKHKYAASDILDTTGIQDTVSRIHALVSTRTEGPALAWMQCVWLCVEGACGFLGTLFCVCRAILALPARHQPDKPFHAHPFPCVFALTSTLPPALTSPPAIACACMHAPDVSLEAFVSKYETPRVPLYALFCTCRTSAWRSLCQSMRHPVCLWC
jgi:hypothetical protein